MKKTKKWAKAFSILLSLSLILTFASSVQGQSIQGKGKKGKGGGGGDKTPMHATASWDEHIPILDSPLVEGTTNIDGDCSGAIVPSNNRSFFTDTGHCFEQLTFDNPGGDPIVVYVVGFTTYRNKTTGEIETIKIALIDLEWVGYQTDKIVAFGLPSPAGFSISVHLDNIPVKRKTKGSSVEVGYISVGVIAYVPK